MAVGANGSTVMTLAVWMIGMVGERGAVKFVDPTSDDTDVSMLFSSGPETPHLMLKQVIQKYTRKHNMEMWRVFIK